MARPIRPIKKSAFINLRVEPAEKAVIQQNAKQLGIHMSPFMRFRAMFVPIRPKYDDYMIHRLDRAAGLVKKIAIHDAREGERWMLWWVLKSMRKTVLAINSVVTREIELPKVIGTGLRSLCDAAEAIKSCLAEAAEISPEPVKIIINKAREQTAAVSGAAEMISAAYRRQLDKVIEDTEEDPVLDLLLDYVVIAAGVKQDIFDYCKLGHSAKQIAHTLHAERGITVPASAIELLIHVAVEAVAK